MLHRIEISTDRTYESREELILKRRVLAAITEACAELNINVNRIQFVKPPTRRSASA